MLKGLEISEIRLSEVLEENENFRFDAEYFKKEYLEKLQQIKKKNFLKLGAVSFITDGIHESINFDEQSGINLISAKSPKENYFDLTGNSCISAQQHANNKRTALQENDIILSTVGTIGNCAIVKNDILPANADRHVGIIRLKDTIKPYFLSSFLLSKYGRFQTLREATGNVQLNLFIYKMKELIVPLLSDNFQNAIEKLCIHAFEKIEESKNLYAQAEQLLLQELGLADFSPTQANINIKNLSESFGTAGRLDAEYYQPKYEDYVNLVFNYKHGFEKLVSCCNVKLNNYMPDDKQKYKYIELSNIGNTGEITSYTYELGVDLPSRARRKITIDDVLISSIEGSLNSCAIVTNAYNNAVCSTGFYVINSEKINSQTLLILFKTDLLQNILKQHCSGTILTAINKDDFFNIPLPLIALNIQEKIADLVQKSFVLKSESSALLQKAKTAVETAIEQGEEHGLELIK